MSRVKIVVSGVVAAAAAAVALAPVIANPTSLRSGVEKGASLPAYHPVHVTGADKGSDTCPVCKYPRNPAAQAWINTDDEKNVAALVAALEKASAKHADSKFKAFVVFMNPNREGADALKARLASLGEKHKIQNVALTFLPGPDDAAVKGYGVNPDAKVRNTIFVYRNRTVDAKMVNFQADEKGIAALHDAIGRVTQ
jgi:protocatechuate 3,4-dioxygenase beta subunit